MVEFTSMSTHFNLLILPRNVAVLHQRDLRTNQDVCLSKKIQSECIEVPCFLKHGLDSLSWFWLWLQIHKTVKMFSVHFDWKSRGVILYFLTILTTSCWLFPHVLTDLHCVNEWDWFKLSKIPCCSQAWLITCNNTLFLATHITLGPYL